MEFPDNGGMFSTDVSAQINQSEQFKLPDMTGTKAILYLIPQRKLSLSTGGRLIIVLVAMTFAELRIISIKRIH